MNIRLHPQDTTLDVFSQGGGGGGGGGGRKHR